MEHIETKVNDIYNKVEKILLLQQKLKEENRSLREENGQLKSNVTQLKNQLTEADSRQKVVKLAKTLAEIPGGAREAKNKVNELIREVDKCLAMLNR